MIVEKQKINGLIRELNDRYGAVITAIEGRQATLEHKREGLKGNKIWTENHLRDCKIVDADRLNLAVSDLTSFLLMIKKLK